MWSKQQQQNIINKKKPQNVFNVYKDVPSARDEISSAILILNSATLNCIQ